MQWHHSWSAVTKNKHGTTGWATLLQSSSSKRPTGTVCRVHLCGDNPCRARWPASKYGLMMPPLHLQLVEAPVVPSAVAEPSGPSLPEPPPPPPPPEEPPPSWYYTGGNVGTTSTASPSGAAPSWYYTGGNVGTTSTASPSGAAPSQSPRNCTTKLETSCASEPYRGGTRSRGTRSRGTRSRGTRSTR